MNCGTPVIAFDSAGPSETIVNGHTGYLIKNYNLNDFAKKAIKLIRDKNLNKKFSINAKEHVRKNFNFNNATSNLEKIF